MKSFCPKDGTGDPPGPGRNRERDFRGERRKNVTHVSISDPDAGLFRKGPGKQARLVFIGHALMENRNGLVVGAVATRASGHAERLAALALIEPHGERSRVTLGADKGYESADFVMELREQTVTRHVRRTRAGGARRSMAAPPAIPAKRSRSASANALRRPLAGPRRWPACARCGIAGCPGSIGNSPSRWPPTILSDCPNCWPRRRRDPRTECHASW